jgi:hypothetical protein
VALAGGLPQYQFALTGRTEYSSRFMERDRRPGGSNGHGWFDFKGAGDSGGLQRQMQWDSDVAET